MRHLTKNFALGLYALLHCLLFGQQALADDDNTPSFFFNVGGGYAVYKSEMVQSNDTSTSVNYGFGVYGGADKSVGMMLQREQGTYTFTLNGSSIITTNQDIHLRYRYGPLYLGLIVNSSQLEVAAPPDADGDGFLDQNTDAEAYMKDSNTGMGANVGFNIAVTRAASVYLDINSVTTSLVQQSYIENAETEANGFTEAEIAIGPRLDIDLGGSIAITKNWLDMNFGFKQRTMSVTVDTSTYKEQINSTYVGLRTGWSF